MSVNSNINSNNTRRDKKEQKRKVRTMALVGEGAGGTSAVISTFLTFLKGFGKLKELNP